MPWRDRGPVARPSRKQPVNRSCRQTARLACRTVARQAVLLEDGQDLRFENPATLGKSRNSEAEE